MNSDSSRRLGSTTPSGVPDSEQERRLTTNKWRLCATPWLAYPAYNGTYAPSVGCSYNRSWAAYTSRVSPTGGCPTVDQKEALSQGHGKH